ncbi:hypothetical protein GH741_14715 [Aquibacillus halophilus]|uniref:DUF4083 domain-containing protein n=1 Tax=Aquibacillus halophilus TaxID=930132 RepID=A0A6A8DE06_9BACI|nr:hypothetical protein [Aquibacillus halophilus]MRH43893.1 hypothetical protein [Aquibacillus halophilus]
MIFLTILLTVIQFSILIYLFFSVRNVKKMMETQQLETNKLLVAIRKIEDKL